MYIKDYLKKYTKQSKKGFTMVEMIAVIIILSIISTATVSIFLSVQTTVRDTSKLTTQQFSTTQMEKFIRNEFQTASNVDIHDLVGGSPTDFTPKANFEFLYYDSKNQQLIFKRYIDASTANNKLIIDQVEDVQIDICPLNYTASDTENMPFKLIYKIKTTSYTYSGGIVLGNSRVSDSSTFDSAEAMFGGDVASLHWFMNPDGETDDEKYDPAGNDNDLCITFRARDTEKTSTDTTST